MPIIQASKEQIDALKMRLAKRQFERSVERDIQEVVRMVQKRPLTQAPKEASETDRTKAIVSKAIAFGMLAAFGAIFWNVTSNAIGLIVFCSSATMSVFKFNEMR